MCCKTKFKNIRAFSLLSVEIRHIMRYNVFVKFCGNYKLWGFHYVGKLQTVMASSH